MASYPTVPTFTASGGQPSATHAPVLVPSPVGTDSQIVLKPVPVTSVALRRREDLVDFTVFMFNLGRLRSLGAPLVRLDPTQNAFLTFLLPPQHIAEEICAVVDSDHDPTPTAWFAANNLDFVRSRAAAPSALVFRVPDATEHIEFTADALLAWQDFEPVFEQGKVPPLAGPSLEIATGLVLTPASPASVVWRSIQGNLTVSGITTRELWHASIDVPAVVPGSKPSALQFKAHYVGPQQAFPGGTPELALASRSNLMNIASQSQTVPFYVNRLALSGLGGWLDVHGQWAKQTDQVAAWRQRIAMGRDQFIRVLDRGWLFPWGHRATLVQIWERIVLPGQPVAGIWHYDVVQVCQPLCVYADTGFGKGKLPFWQIRALVTETPKLIPVEDADQLPPAAFLQTAAKTNYLMPFVGTDFDGQDHAFSAAALFVPITLTTPQAESVRAEYETWAEGNWTTDPDPNGARVAFSAKVIGYADAASSGGRRGDAGIVTDAMRFTVVTRPKTNVEFGTEQLSAPFTPAMDVTQVRLSALAHLGSTGVAPAVDAVYPAAFTGGAPLGERFLDFLTPQSAGFDQRKVGAIAAPQLALDGIEVANGLVPPTAATIQDIVGATQILGGIKLAEILPDGALPSAIRTTPIYAAGDMAPSAFKTEFHWTVPTLNSTGIFEALDSSDPAFELHVVVRVAAGSPITQSASGLLRGFAINISGIFRLTIKALSFRSANGGKPDFSAELPDRPLTFDGPLAFLNVLMENLPSNPFSDPPAIAITPQGIVSTFSAALPNMPLGCMSLENVSLSAGLSLPFSADPLQANFGFASRERQFHLIVGALGGGGFLSLSGGAKGIDTVEAALEFGGSLAFDIGVASGGIAIMAGIYFKLSGSEVTLTGYLRASGALEVLGIISLTVEFDLSLTYDSGPPPKVWGEAVVSVEVSIAFFSKSVSLHMRREFSNSQAYHFTDLFPPDGPTAATSIAWTNYCQAFAVDS